MNVDRVTSGLVVMVLANLPAPFASAQYGFLAGALVVVVIGVAGALLVRSGLQA